jgi:hypothetical protein
MYIEYCSQQRETKETGKMDIRSSTLSREWNYLVRAVLPGRSRETRSDYERKEDKADVRLRQDIDSKWNIVQHGSREAFWEESRFGNLLSASRQ